VWPTSEHAYQAAKFRSGEFQERIMYADSAHDAKVRARSLSEYVRPDWDDVKLGVMEEICRAKLEQHEFIQESLRKTGDREIIEDSPKDAFWGWGPDQKGENHLGKIWMKLRDEME